MPREAYDGHVLNYMWIIEPPDSETKMKVANFCHTCAGQGLDPNACSRIAAYNAEQVPAFDG